MYISIDDVQREIPEDKLIQLTDDHQLGAIDPAVVDQAIAAAGGEIDAYVQVRYGESMPISPAPGILKALCLTIVTYRLCNRRGRMEERIYDQYKTAQRTLEKIAAGSIQLGNTDIVPDAPLFSAKRPADRQFHPANMEGYL